MFHYNQSFSMKNIITRMRQVILMNNFLSEQLDIEWINLSNL